MRAPWLSTSAEKLLWKLPSSRRAHRPASSSFEAGMPTPFNDLIVGAVGAGCL